MDPTHLTKAQLRQLDRTLAPCARAFDRAKREGWIALASDGFWRECVDVPPPSCPNPDQLELT